MDVPETRNVLLGGRSMNMQRLLHPIEREGKIIPRKSESMRYEEENSGGFCLLITASHIASFLCFVLKILETQFQWQSMVFEDFVVHFYHSSILDMAFSRDMWD